MIQRKGKAEIDMLHGPILPALIRFAIPVLFSSIFQQLYNTMDTVIVGHTLGETSLAAIGAALPAYDLLMGFALGIGNGLSIVTARSYGSKNETMLKKSVACALVIGAVLTVILTLFTRVGLMPFLKLLNTPEEILEEAYAYSSCILLFLGVTFAYNLGAGILRAVGNSVMPLVFLVISSVLNVVLDLWFIRGLGMGVEGAAIATVVAQGISAVLCVLYILKSVRMLIPSKEHFKLDKKLYLEMIAQGGSMGLMSCLVYAGTAILQTGINDLGYLVIAGHTAARKLFSFFLMPLSAMLSAVNTFVSQNFGAGNIKRIRKAMKTAYLYNAAVTVVLTIIANLFAPALIQLLTGSDNAVIIENGAQYLRVAIPAFVVLGMLNDTRNALQAIGSKVLPLFSSIIEVIGKILFVSLLVPKYQYQAVIYCEPVIWVFMTAELVAAFWLNPVIRGKKEKSGN